MRHLLFIVTIIALLACIVGGVSAQTGGRLPTADVFVRSTDTTQSFNGQGLSLFGSTAACNKTDWTYLQWDLTGISSTIGRALLTLHVTAVNSVLSSTTISLYETTDFYKGTAVPWTEAGLLSNNAPDAGTLIESISAPATTGGTVSFGSGAGASSLSTYLDGQRASDGKASVVMLVTGTCSQGTRLGFGDRENATSTLRPGLELFSPTAVEMSKADAVQASWPLYAGLGAVALFVVAGIVITRRRTI